MSEVENNEEVAVAETEVEQQNVGNIEDLVNAISQQNFNRAKDHFDSILGDKMNDAIEAEKIAVADGIFNDAPEEEQLELDLDDEDVLEDEVEVEEDDVVVDEVLEDEVEVEDEVEDEVVVDEIADEDEN